MYGILTPAEAWYHNDNTHHYFARAFYGPLSLRRVFLIILLIAFFQIDDEFDRMYPNRNAIGTISSISSFCMMLDHSYNEIACPSIQALLKVMSELTSQGNIRKAEPSGLPPLEEFASVFVRWLQPGTDIDHFLEHVPGEPPYILCSTMAFAENKYYIVVLRTAFDCGFMFVEALDLLIKAYKVFNFEVPGKAKKVLEFFDLIYGLHSNSRLSSVNNLFAKIKSATNM
ncbi:uncharacterized protein LOC131691427 [Topomyia yanbarensis]|uniref:uncharacterized protein LOC131683807 n=1 Tax=Topomyia yanbarensis TaxID=2498891 RepID=UPI00273BC78F|nr:uncharacterized protein LOC131683807 [Topomyia yanbarensis]XP_058822125.1 uncharacterized protein LOC131683807 [Topomyia yanbarensis]XP_058833158.1 uncharacterized protein LOC131691035 [Topomyia yanbarensis]XP_058833791.1 uncharacterized protein LOC131691427 [Topomyia yanbarensis]